MVRIAKTVILLALVGVVAAAVGLTSAAQATELEQPSAPIAAAGGDSVTLAFSLPGRRVDAVEILRAERDARAFSILAEVDPTALMWTDTEVTLGATYLYAIRTRRGSLRSAPSAHAEVTIGGSTRLTLLGGSTERAWFEVVMFRDGKRLSARFVHRPGDAIGDLVWSEEAGRAVDFRLGPRLTSLLIGESTATETERVALTGTDGKALTGTTGTPLELEFKFPAEQHESITAELLHGTTRHRLVQGESIAID